MKLSTTLSVLLLAGAAFAQGTQMPLPGFTSTYSNSGHTRGFYFQAPSTAPFIIAGLRVPDETGHGTQNVEVIRYSAQPAIFPASGTGTQLFYSAGQPSANVIPTSITVNPGEWIGVLGACGDSSIMHSSYGAGAFTSDVLGAPVTLYRLLTQTNIAATGGNQPTSGFVSTSSIGRVEVYVTPAAGFAQSNPYGMGCGSPAMTLSSDRPIEGSTMNVTVSDIPANSLLGTIVISGTQILPGAQPVPGLGSCFQYVGLDDVYTFPTMGSSYVQPFSIPGTGFTGMQFYAQAITLSPGINPLGVASTNGLEWVIDAN